MGKKKIDNIKYMEDKNLRNITFSKRKRGLLKKVIELSSLCGQDILMFIYDKTKSKIIEFRSDFNFDTDFVKKLLQNSSFNNLNHEYCQKSDYW
jgi:hypothetical protein